jgi:hypothetical protein
MSYPSMSSASEGTNSPCQLSSVPPNEYGMISLTPSTSASTKHCESKTLAPYYVACGNVKEDATRNMMACMPVQVVEDSCTVLAHALEHEGAGL